MYFARDTHGHVELDVLASNSDSLGGRGTARSSGAAGLAGDRDGPLVPVDGRSHADRAGSGLDAGLSGVEVDSASGGREGKSGEDRELHLKHGKEVVSVVASIDESYTYARGFLGESSFGRLHECAAGVPRCSPRPFIRRRWIILGRNILRRFHALERMWRS